MDRVFVICTVQYVDTKRIENNVFSSLELAEEHVPRIKGRLVEEYLNELRYPEQEVYEWRRVEQPYIGGCIVRYFLLSRNINEEEEYQEQHPEIHICEWNFVDYPKNIKAASKK